MKNLRRNFYVQLFIVALLAGMFVPLAVNNVSLQAGFTISGSTAKVYIAGVSYGGNAYMSSSSLKTTGEVFKWEDDKLHFDLDKSIECDAEVTVTTNNKFAPLELSDYTGLLPDVMFEITESPYLVDLSGNPKSSGYTQLLTTSEGYDMYVYHYNMELSMSVFADVEKNSDIYKYIGNTDPAFYKYDGNVVGSLGMSEFGVINNLYAMLALNLPTQDGWVFGWEGDVNSVSVTFKSSLDGTTFSEGDVYAHVKDTYPERLTPLGADYVFHVNINEGVKLSHSVNGRLSLNNVGGVLASPIGADSISSPGAYSSWYSQYAWTGLVGEWDMLNPTITYGLTLKVSAINKNSDTNTNTNTGTATNTGTSGAANTNTFNPEEGFDFLQYWKELSNEQKILLGGVVFVGIILIGAILKRKSERSLVYGGYY